MGQRHKPVKQHIVCCFECIHSRTRHIRGFVRRPRPRLCGVPQAQVAEIPEFSNHGAEQKFPRLFYFYVGEKIFPYCIPPLGLTKLDFYLQRPLRICFRKNKMRNGRGSNSVYCRISARLAYLNSLKSRRFAVFKLRKNANRFRGK